MATLIFRIFITDIRTSAFSTKIYYQEIWKNLNLQRPMNFKDIDYGSLVYWHGESECSLYEAV